MRFLKISNDMKKIILCAMPLLIAANSLNATTIGYCKSSTSRTNTFRVGSTTTQGQAIRLTKAKLQALKGKTINYAEFAVGSKNCTGNTLKVFLSTSPDGEPIAEGTVTVSKALDNCRWTLDKPYTITGEEESLYIGYTAEIATTYKMLLSDGSYDIKGYNYAYEDGQWVDTYGLNRGSAMIRANIDGDVSYTDVIMARNNFDGYFKAGDKCDIAARFVNAGTTAVNSFDAVIKVGDNTTTQHFDGLDIEPKEAYSLALGSIDSSREGEQNIDVSIANVNGGDESDTSDNGAGAQIFFYPNNMERSILLEGFTGQDCSNCPSGHLTINNAIANCGEDIVEVSHHAGYYPDRLTMAEDDAYRFYYSNPTSTFAPAVMVNRSADNSVSLSPVVNTVYSDILQLISHAAASKPYVSLNLESQLDSDSRELKVKVQILPHTTLPTDNVLFNVFLVQDSIVAYQANGGTNYVHNRVFRGTLTDNSWGIATDELTPGRALTWEKTITIPEQIHSSYWTDDLIEDGKYSGKYNVDQCDIEAVLKNMTLVAYVAEYDTSDNTKNVVYNCCETRLGQNYRQRAFDIEAGIDDKVAQGNDVDIAVKDGHIDINGTHCSANVYTADGRKVDAAANLQKGVYIVKVANGGTITSKKVLVK